MSLADAAIVLDGVEKNYPSRSGIVTALQATGLAVRRGEILVVIGPSGCGKTTLLRLIAGLIQPSAGSIVIAGRDLWQDGRRNTSALDSLGVVFQEANLFPWYTVERNIALPLALRGMPADERRERVRALAQLVDIAGFEASWPRELSGGMQQRAAIARALSCGPEILLLDEPFGALDALTRDAMGLELQRIWLATGCTIVLVTHAISEAVFLADRVVLLSRRPGRIETVIDIEAPRPRTLDIQATAGFQRIAADLRARLGQPA